jgi:hypothetical protein
MDGPRTISVAIAESEPGLPVALIVYKPDGTLNTTNVPVRLPPESEQVENGNGVEKWKTVSEHEESDV